MEVRSPLTGTVFRVLVQPGDAVGAGDTLIVLESMKMEIEVNTYLDGTVTQVLKSEGDVVQAEEPLVILE